MLQGCCEGSTRLDTGVETGGQLLRRGSRVLFGDDGAFLAERLHFVKALCMMGLYRLS